MNNKAGNRILSMLLTLALLWGGLPIIAFADGGCTHVCGDGTCSYVEGADCNHVHDGICGGLVASVKEITFDIPLNEFDETWLFLTEGVAVTDADLLAGVTAFDESGGPVTMTVKDVDGLNMQNPAPKSAVYPNPPYVITYAAAHPLSGDEFTEVRECYVTAAVAVPTGDGTTQGNPCTSNTELQTALNNAAATGDTIYVGSFAFAGVISIPDGKNVTIEGVGGNVTLTAGSSRHFELASGSTATLTFIGVTLDGSGSGGGIDNSGNLTLNGVTIRNCNVGNSSGGGINNNHGATLTITNSTITGNRAGNGGGINNYSTVTVTNSAISGNFSASSGDSEITNHGMFTIGSGSTVSGGVLNYGTLNNSGTITIPSSKSLSNSAWGTSGTINNNGDITIASGGSFDNWSGCTVNNNSGGVINNNGAISNNGRINGNAITGTGSFSGNPVNYVPPVPPPPITPPTTRGQSSNSGGGSYTPAPTETWLDGVSAADLAANARSRGKNFVRTRSAIVYRIRAAAWAKFAGLRYEHDTMDGGAVQVRLYVKNPENLTKDMIVSCYTKGFDVERVKACFEKWFKNNLRAIHFGHQGAWGQPVEVAVKLDFIGMDTENLRFYAYDNASGTYKRIKNPKYRIDKNGFLHFTTEYAGDIVISEGPLKKK